MNRKERRAAGKRTGGRVSVIASPSSMTSNAQLFAVALRYHQTGRLAEAEALYRNILAVDPRHSDSLHSLGVIAYHAGRNDIAVDIIEQAIALNGQNPVFYNNLGNALQARGSLDEALESYRRALALDPDFSMAHYNVGNVLREQGNLNEAVESYRRALTAQPDYTAALNNLGSTLQAQGRFAEAAQSYQRALGSKPDYAEALNNLGSTLQAQGKFAEAAQSYQRALAIKPDYAEAHNNRGNLHLERGEFSEAAEHYQRALALRPGSAETHNNLGNTFHALGKLRDAAVAYERAASLGHVAARHMAAALNGETPEQPPRAYVVNMFDAYAVRFEAHLVGSLAYRTPQTLREMLGALNMRRVFERTVDLGCGTGLAGVTFRDLTRELVGVDLASKMVSQAAGKAIYDRLDVADVVEFLDSEKDKFDFFIAADLLGYLGALDTLFTAMASRARPGAILALSAEISVGADYELTSSGRYAQSRDYLERQLGRVGGRVLACETHPMRLQAGQPVDGYHIIGVVGGSQDH
jgi:predicted TPR repeat methyltransferase